MPETHHHHGSETHSHLASVLPAEYATGIDLQERAKFQGDDHIPDHSDLGEHDCAIYNQMKTGDEYVKNPGHCPRCDSDQIEGGPVDIVDGGAHQEIGCNDCNLAYHDSYTLTGYSTEIEGEGYTEYNSNPAGFLFTDEQRDTILAALRLWQAFTRGELASKPIDDRSGFLEAIATNAGKHAPLTSEEIDQLIETLQYGPGESPRTHHWVVDECPDAYGFHTIRLADGTPNGNTNEQPIATVYEEKDAQRIVSAVNQHGAEQAKLTRAQCDPSCEHESGGAHSVACRQD